MGFYSRIKQTVWTRRAHLAQQYCLHFTILIQYWETLWTNREELANYCLTGLHFVLNTEIARHLISFHLLPILESKKTWHQSMTTTYGR